MKRTIEEEKKELNKIQRLCYNARNCLREQDCGIDCYLNKFEGLPGILKSTCDDFIVQEIDEQGKPVELINSSEPEELQNSPMNNEEGMNELKMLYNDEIMDQINTFCNTVKENPKMSEGLELKHTLAKEQRKRVHQIIRECFPSLLSDTTSEGNVILYSHGNRDHSKRLDRNGWRYKGKDYVLFTLKKKEMDTMSCLTQMAAKQHRKSNIYTYIGVKDKRAITYQKIAGYRVTPTEIYNTSKLIKNIEVGDFELIDHPLRIADSCGNKFTIYLRNVTPLAKEEQLDYIIKEINKNGYLNYYGLQRFGTGVLENNTYIIGRDILNSDWKAVVDKLFDSIYNESLAKAYSYYNETKDIQGACKMLPFKFKAESEVLRALHKSNGQYTNAFASLPIKKRTIFIHGLQSYFFNKFVSYRISTYGTKVIPGDFVYEDQEQDQDQEEDNYELKPIHIITEEEVDQYSLSDVLLPLPGTDTLIPSYLQDYYTSLLNTLHLTRASWNHPIAVYSMKGTYRKILYKPKDLEATLIHEEVSIRLSFILGGGCYATMLLREITHLGTDKYSQLMYEQSTTPLKE